MPPRGRYPLQKSSSIQQLHDTQDDHPPVLENQLESDLARAQSPSRNGSPHEDDRRSDESTSSLQGEGRRTLRRTPRSRRIHPMTPPLRSDEALLNGRSPGTAETVTNETYGLRASTSPAYMSDASSENEWEECSEQSQPTPKPNRDRKQLRPSRHAYPLQAPASSRDLRGGDDGSLPLVEQPTSAHQPSADNPLSARKPKGRRQVYPLQSPASKAILAQPPTPPSSSPEREPERAASTTGYQRLIGPLSPPSSPDRASNTVTEAGSQNTPFRRQTYPLQRSSSPTGEQQNMLRSQELKEKEAEVAAKVVKEWRRQTLHSRDGSLSFDPASKAQSHDRHWTTPPETEALHLPQNIRAASNAEKQAHGGRTIVVCLDGTGDKFDNDNSNIVHLVSALKKDDANQVTYYQAGIGTYGEGGLSGGFNAALDMAVGSGLGLHIRDAYHFIMHTYKEGDKICIFGFSRGAYTARCLAGMIHKVGLLPPRNVQQIPFAYEFYTKDTAEGWKQSEDFKAAFCIDVCVYFLGCFDSVASVGFIPRQLPLSSTPGSKPRYFRHAMALDERRAKFKICRHQTKDWEDIDEGEPERQGKHPNLADEEYLRLVGDNAPFKTDVLEVWFAGAHADVGGGAVPNVERHKLAQIPLRWMIRQAFECQTGIVFKTSVLAEFGLDVHTLWPIYQGLSVPTRAPPPSLLERYEKDLPPRSIRRGKLVPTDRHERGEQLFHLNSPADEDWTSEQLEDFFDALTPMNDQLIQAPNWWILELIPVQYKLPLGGGEYAMRTGMNLGRYRGVEDLQPNVHWTVVHRSEQMGYRVQARTAPSTTWLSVV